MILIFTIIDSSIDVSYSADRKDSKDFSHDPFLFFFLYRENVSRMYVREGGELSMKL